MKLFCIRLVPESSTAAINPTSTKEQKSPGTSPGELRYPPYWRATEKFFQRDSWNSQIVTATPDQPLIEEISIGSFGKSMEQPQTGPEDKKKLWARASIAQNGKAWFGDPLLDFSMDYIQGPSFLILAHILWLGVSCWEKWEWEESDKDFLGIAWSSIQMLRDCQDWTRFFLAEDFESFDVGDPEIYWIKMEHSGPSDLCLLYPKLEL